MAQKHDKEKVWNDVLGSLKVGVSPAIFSTWLSQTHLESLRKVDDKRYIAEIGCNSGYVKATVEKRYFGLTQDALMKVLAAPCDLTFTVKAAATQIAKDEGFAPLFEESETSEIVLEKIVQAKLRPGLTFDNFAVSSSNQLAHAAAEAVVHQPGIAYNPLFIWGGVGVGKTHLMHAIGHSLLLTKSVKVLACTGEDFTNDIVEGIRHKTTQAVRNKYRKLDVLLIDDIQFIAGKDTVQEEFFHTFNSVTASGGQVVMTSDKPPSEIAKLEERLRSRFEAGMTVDIAQPDFELRCAIIQIKAKEKGIDINEDHVQLIAGNVESPRKIEGVLTRLMSETKIRKIEISEQLIKKNIGYSGEENTLPKRVSADQVIEAVCSHYSVGKRAMLGKGRTKTIVYPRQILMYLLRIELRLPLEEVGRLIGGRDHTTIMHGVDKITKLTSNDPQLRDDLLRIKQLV